MIQTDATGKATLSFFTSDNKAAIRVKVEGTTVDGMTGVGQQQIHTE
jgi:hypothetical protein